jgi:hypothetical protein
MSQKGKVPLQPLHPDLSTSPANVSLGQAHTSDGQTPENEGPPSYLTMAPTQDHRGV